MAEMIPRRKDAPPGGVDLSQEQNGINARAGSLSSAITSVGHHHNTSAERRLRGALGDAITSGGPSR